jgi:DNA polymerase III, delta subunit
MLKSYKNCHSVLFIFPRETLTSVNFFQNTCNVFGGMNEVFEQENIYSISHPDIVFAPPKKERETLRKEDVEQLRELSFISPTQAEKRIMFIEGAERLLPHAANSLLKCIEEPQASVQWIFSAHSARDVLPTLLSRCVRIYAPKNLFEQNDKTYSQNSEKLESKVQNLFELAIVERAKALPKILEQLPMLSKEYSSQAALDYFVKSLSLFLRQGKIKIEESRWILASLRFWKEALPYNLGLQNLMAKVFIEICQEKYVV